MTSLPPPNPLGPHGMAPQSLCHQGDPPKPVAAGERGLWGFAIQPGSFFGHPKCKGWLSWQQATAGNKENCSRSARTILTKDFFLLYVFFFFILKYFQFLALAVSAQQNLRFGRCLGCSPAALQQSSSLLGRHDAGRDFWGDGEDLGTSYVTSFPCPQAPPALGCGQVRLQDQSSPVTVGEVEIKLQEGENQILPMGIHHFSRFHVP